MATHIIRVFFWSDRFLRKVHPEVGWKAVYLFPTTPNQMRTAEAMLSDNLNGNPCDPQRHTVVTHLSVGATLLPQQTSPASQRER